MREPAVASARERCSAAASVAGTVGVLGILYLIDPSTSTLLPTCPFLGLTGCYCPGCGSLRALHQITRGRVAGAFGLNPLLILSLPFFGYVLACRIALAFRGRPLKTFFIPPVFVWALLGIIVLYWVLRNVPVHPFSLLAP